MSALEKIRNTSPLGLFDDILIKETVIPKSKRIRSLFENNLV